MWLERLKKALRSKGISLYRLAKLTGMRYESLRRSFNEDRQLRANELLLIMEKAGITYEEIRR